MNYMNDFPEEMDEIARLPLNEQNDALREFASRRIHCHRSLNPSTGEGAVSSSSAGSPSPVDDHCDVCGAPVGKHHLSYCDLRGDV